MNALIRLYADAMEAKTKRENGFDLNEYDKKCLDFAREYAMKLLAVDINIPIHEMLDTGWDLLQKYFEKYEVGIKEYFIEKYWKAEDSGEQHVLV
jgi:V/A-type H+-transporting ATPase subunit B